jgi:hypothetical protein
MIAQIARASMIGFAAIAFAVPAFAQQAPVEVTFAVPLNLTRLPSVIPKVRVICTLNSSAIVESINVPGSRPLQRVVSSEMPVSQGEVVQTAQLVITLDPSELDAPSGKQAQYECRLDAFVSTFQSWQPFRDSVRSGSIMVSLVVTPDPAPITGIFVW